MRKITLLLATIIVILGNNLFAQTTVFDINESFSSNVSDWGFTLSNGATQTNTYDATNKQLQIRWPNANSEYIKTLTTAITPGTDNKVTVDLII